MVCMRMGLLDDAIREHLELKRRRGADPGEVAREQREALDSARERSTAGAETETPMSSAGVPLAAPLASAEAGDAETRGDDVHDMDARAGDRAPAVASDETAELDMRAVLGEDEQAADPGAAGPAHAGVPDASGPDPEEDSLEWEVPGDAAHEQADESAEDVLEETPDFLRDTPEQDRLWFAQRPPRNFDFDK
jgi:hypothetical protein